MAIRIDQDKQRQVVVREVSKRIGVDLEFHSADGYDIYCRDSKGRSYAIILTSGYDNGVNVRGVVRNRIRGGKYSFLPNGQVGTKGQQVGWWQEKACSEPDSEQTFYIKPDEYQHDDGFELVDGKWTKVDEKPQT